MELQHTNAPSQVDRTLCLFRRRGFRTTAPSTAWLPYQLNRQTYAIPQCALTNGSDRFRNASCIRFHVPAPFLSPPPQLFFWSAYFPQ